MKFITAEKEQKKCFHSDEEKKSKKKAKMNVNCQMIHITSHISKLIDRSVTDRAHSTIKPEIGREQHRVVQGVLEQEMLSL